MKTAFKQNRVKLPINFNNSNLSFNGTGRDGNGNKTIKLCLPGISNFSFQINEEAFRNTSYILRGMTEKDFKTLLPAQMDQIEQECKAYILKHGGAAAKYVLKDYANAQI